LLAFLPALLWGLLCFLSSFLLVALLVVCLLFLLGVACPPRLVGCVCRLFLFVSVLVLLFLVSLLLSLLVVVVLVGSCLPWLCALVFVLLLFVDWGFPVPASVSLALVLFSCLGLLCSCGAALSGAPLFPLFLALFFFVGVLVWVVVSSL
jgi:hypothetical protein